MNNLLADYARKKIKEGLSKLLEKHRKFFKRLYGYDGYGDDHSKLSIDEVIKNMSDEKLDRALTQVQNTLKKRESKNKLRK